MTGLFHPAVQRWFSQQIGTPTDVQAQAWPSIASGKNILVTAPTGSGKTLAAFLWALDNLLSGAWQVGSLRVLYISPLKALNNDIRKNLLVPLAQIQPFFAEMGLSCPHVDIMTRSGDSTDEERRRLRKRPPEILITTPESLNILLTQKGAGALFAGIRTVIVDEIHAVVGSKRGTSLVTALERLVRWSGEFQRIGLSATVNPPELVARYLGGFSGVGEPRAVELIQSAITKAYEVQVLLPKLRPAPDDTGKVFWESLALELRKRVADRDSTLIFTNSRRSCEKLARLINENQPELLAYSHHGSLSKDLRLDVEERLKTGTLKALVATNSLELGIDIGDLDEVILAQTPRTAASAIQKVGRAGHRIGEVSKARLYPSHGLDLVEAAVIVRCIRDQAVEPLVIPEGPLDVLAQTLLSELSSRPGTADDLFGLVRCAWPYRNLSRHTFDLVLDMLAGRYAGTRIPELKPRIEMHPATGAWSAKDAVPFLLYSSGGTIPDRGYFAMKHWGTGSTLGELDEEFVWERQLGDRFALGSQVWKIAAIDDQAVRVEPVDAPPHIIPFWKGEDQDRSWFLAEKIGLFLAEAESALQDEPAVWKTGLIADGFSTEAADQLVSTLERQRKAIGTLPHRWRLVIERVVAETPGVSERTDTDQYVVHTFWGARINRPWAFALAQAWEDHYGYALETYPGDDQVLILVPPETNLEEAFSLVTASNLEDLLRRRLEATGYFGARFREGAGRALLLPKAGFDKRTPLWQTRLKAKRLFAAVAQFADFPILYEAWRQCLHDEFDLEALKARMEELDSGRVEIWRCQTTEPSPFTEGLLWRQINEKVYDGDEPSARRASGLEPSLWNQLLSDDRPRLPTSVAEEWEARWGRTAPGYAPETPADLIDLLEVRVALSESEWQTLLNACARDSGQSVQDWESAVDVVHTGGKVGVSGIAGLWSRPQGLWLRWLEGRGPLPVSVFAQFWECDPLEVSAWAQQQAEAGLIVFAPLTQAATEPEICVARTWDLLVRRLRLDRRATIPVRSAAGLPVFLADWQGLVHPDRDPGNLESRIGPLLGLPLPAELWESAVLPSRTAPYWGAEFDRLFLEGGLRWFGCGPQKVLLGFPEDRDVFLTGALETVDTQKIDEIFGSGQAPKEASFTDLAARTGLPTGALTETLWDLAWQGGISATTFGPLRQGIRSDFRYEASSTPGKVPARGFQRWASARNSSGTWRRWDTEPDTNRHGDQLEKMEAAKRRARLVLDRYGIVFRSLLTHENPSFQWKALFPAFRLMELSGEIFGGLFWEGIPGLQFATPEALRALESPVDDETLWIQHAQDPTSLCGLGLDALGYLPRRVQGSWLWWRGARLQATLSASGKKLDTTVQADTGDLTGFIKRTAEVLLTGGRTNWTLEFIDGLPADKAALTPAFLQAGFRAHGEKLILWKV